MDTKNVSKVIIEWKNACLLLQRAGDGTWELPGGHLELGETFKQGAKREVFEETQIKISKLKTIIKDKHANKAYVKGELSVLSNYLASFFI